MKYSELTLSQFLDEVYELYGSPIVNNVISSVEMYQFIKEKTNGFDISCFEYLIQDIRSYHDNVQFKYRNPIPKQVIEINPETGYPTTESEESIESYKPYLISDLSDVFLEIQFNIKLEITGNTTLRQRIDLFKEAFPQASILHNIKALLKFSDIAEKEFENIKPKISNPKPVEESKTNLKTSTISQNDQLPNTETSPLFSLSISEFCDNLYNNNNDIFLNYDYSLDVSETQMYDYIKLVTNNFNKEHFENLLFELREYIFKMTVKSPNNYLDFSENNNTLFENIEDLRKYLSKKFTIKTIDKDFDLFDFNSLSISNVEKFNTLRERIRELKYSNPEIIFNTNLTALLVFSDMAVNQYNFRNQSPVFFTGDSKGLKQPLNPSASKFRDIIENKKYLDLTPTEFCNYIYKPISGLEEQEIFDNNPDSWRFQQTPERITFQYIKTNSNDFDSRSFEYLINEIRNYIKHLTFHLPEIYQDGTAFRETLKFKTDANGNNFLIDQDYFNILFNQPEFTLTTISNWDGIGPSTIDFKQVFNEKLTLSERFMILTELLPMASFRYGIFNLLHFSDFAEKEYKKLITNNIPTENVIPTHLQNVEIKNYIPAQINNLDPANTHNKITKDSFIELIREIDKQMPDTEVRRVFLENRFIGMGYSVELGYKQTSYFYNELKKARDGQESIYKGTLVNKEDTFALVDSYTCYFKMNHVHFNNLEILVNTPMDGSISNTIEPPKTTSKINQSNPELTLAHIALICYYQNIIINTSNAESILNKFNNPSTPKKIIERYNHFMQKNNRVCCDETKRDKAKHKRLLEVVQYLKNKNLEHESAVSDLKILEKNMNISKY